MRVEEFFRLTEGCLIVFGLSFTAALTDGPFGIFDKIRTKIASTTKKKWIRTGSQCPICLSCWIALGFTCVVTSLSPDGSEEE